MAGGARGRPDFHDLRFLLAHQLIDLLDALVDGRLHLLAALLVVVLGDLARALVLLEQLVGFAALVADGDARLLAHALDHLGEVAAPLLGQ
jgi:hypothetical protein